MSFYIKKLRFIKNRTLIAIPVVFLVLVIFHVWSLMRYPAPNVDEVWLISRAWAFIHTGHQYGQLDSGIAEKFDGYWVVNQWLITALQALVLSFSKVPSLLPVRILSLGLGLVLLSINYQIAHFFGRSPLAVASTILLALSTAFLNSAHMARYDILAAVFAYAAVLIAIKNQSGRFWTGVLAGAILGLAIETHLNSLLFVPVVGAIYLVNHGWSFYRRPVVWGYIIGLILGAIYFLSLHVFPYPETYFKINNQLNGQSLIPPIFTLNPQMILAGFMGSSNLILVSAFSMVPLGLWVIPDLIRSRSKNGIQILVVNLILFICSALIMPKKNGYYAILLAPAFLWLVAWFIIDFLKKPWYGRWIDYLSRTLVWALIMAAIAFCVVQTVPDRYQKYLDAQANVNTWVQEEDTLIGSQWLWLGLPDHRFYSWELLFLYPRFYPGKTLADTFELYRPDLFIIDQPLDDLTRDDIAPNTIWYYNHVPRAELYAYLDKHAQLVATQPTELYGNIRIYRFSWKE